MLELHQLDWQLQLTGAVSDMHSSKAVSSALSVQFTLKLIITGLCSSAGTLLWPALLMGTNSVQVIQLCQQWVMTVSDSGTAYTVVWSEVVPPSSIRGKLSGVAACI